MKAVAQHAFGPPPEVLHVEEVDVPVVGAHDVLLRVCAAGIGPHVWHAATGLPLVFVRLTGAGLRAPRASVPRSDVAGVVVGTGASVDGFRPGDAVYGTSPGALAEYACTPADRLSRKPEGLTFVEAAAVPISGCAALRAVRDVARVREGERVLVIGAAGGVGSFAVQIAEHLGAHVTGVCRTEHAAFVRGLGADAIVDYTVEDITDGSRRYDAVIDTAGRRPLAHLRRALEPHGTLVIVGGEGGGRWTGGFGRAVVRAPLVSLVTRQRLRPLISDEPAEDLRALTHLIEAGAVRPAVTRVLPLGAAAEALADAEQGHGRGKTVIAVTDETG